MAKDKSAVALGKRSANKLKRTLGSTDYKEEMSRRGKNGATKRWKVHKQKLSPSSVIKG